MSPFITNHLYHVHLLHFSFYKTPINGAENGGYCGGNGGVSKLPSRTVVQILEKAKMYCIGLPSLVDIEITNK